MGDFPQLPPQRQVKKRENREFIVKTLGNPPGQPPNAPKTSNSPPGVPWREFGVCGVSIRRLGTFYRGIFTLKNHYSQAIFTAVTSQVLHSFFPQGKMTPGVGGSGGNP